MKTVVVYYSLEGNVDFAAQRVAEALGADTLRISPKKSIPTSGARKFMWGGMTAVMALKPKLEDYTFDASAYDRVIIGFPVWASNVAPPINSFLSQNNLDGKQIAAFACQAGNGAEQAFAKLKAQLGIDAFEAEMILIDPLAKPSEENDAKIQAFCDQLNA